MGSRRNQLSLHLIVAGLAVTSLLAGCNQVNSNHEVYMNEAEQRWNNMRSGVMLQMAQGQFDAGDLDQAEKTLHDAIATDGSNARLHLLAGRIALERGKLERAYQRIENAISLDPEIPDSYYYQGLVLQRWQRYDAALERYTRSYELEPDNVAYLLAMSEMYVARNQIDEALALLNAKMNYFDTNAIIRMAIGQLHILRQDYAQAAEYFHKASILQPDDLAIVEELAMAQMASGQPDRAVKNFIRLLNDGDYQDRPDIMRALAEGYYMTGRTDQAKATLVAMTRKDPEDFDAWNRLGQIAWAEDDHLAVMSAARRLLKLDPNHPDGYLLAGMVWQQRGELEKALNMFDKVAKLSPTDSEGLVLRGIALERAGRIAEAKQAYSKALERNPHDRRIRGLVAQVSTD